MEFKDDQDRYLEAAIKGKKESAKKNERLENYEKTIDFINEKIKTSEWKKENDRLFDVKTNEEIADKKIIREIWISNQIKGQDHDIEKFVEKWREGERWKARVALIEKLKEPIINQENKTKLVKTLILLITYFNFFYVWELLRIIWKIKTTLIEQKKPGGDIPLLHYHSNEQGVGKTTYARAILEPVAVVKYEGNVNQLLKDKHGGRALQENVVVLWDEAKVDYDNHDQMKRTMTEDKTDQRGIYVDKQMKYVNKLTFISTGQYPTNIAFEEKTVGWARRYLGIKIDKDLKPLLSSLGINPVGKTDNKYKSESNAVLMLWRAVPYELTTEQIREFIFDNDLTKYEKKRQEEEGNEPPIISWYKELCNDENEENSTWIGDNKLKVAPEKAFTTQQLINNYHNWLQQHVNKNAKKTSAKKMKQLIEGQLGSYIKYKPNNRERKQSKKYVIKKLMEEQPPINTELTNKAEKQARYLIAKFLKVDEKLLPKTPQEETESKNDEKEEEIEWK